jgi:hypothetical protein
LTNAVETVYHLFEHGEEQCRALAMTNDTENYTEPEKLGVGTLANVLNSAGAIVLTYRFNLTKPKKGVHLGHLRRLAVEKLVGAILHFIHEAQGVIAARGLPKLRGAAKALQGASSAMKSKLSNYSQSQEMVVLRLNLILAGMKAKALQAVANGTNRVKNAVAEGKQRLKNGTSPFATLAAMEIQANEAALAEVAPQDSDFGAFLGDFARAKLDSLQQQVVALVSSAVGLVEQRVAKALKNGTSSNVGERALDRAEGAVEKLGSRLAREELVTELLARVGNASQRLEAAVHNTMQGALSSVVALVDSPEDAIEEPEDR